MRRGLSVGLLCTALLAAAAMAGGGPKTKLISKTNGGAPAAADANADEITPDGRFVVFSSEAGNLPGGGGGDDDQAYLHDRRKGKTRLISKTSDGEPANGPSDDPSISSSGRFVAFDSDAGNLPGLNGVDRNVYVHDRRTGKTKLVSKTSGGDPADGHSDNAMISGSGRFVAFDSDAGNLPGGTGGGFRQVYVHDRRTGKTRLVSRTSDGDPADDVSREPTISQHGRHISFESDAPNLGAGDFLRLYVRDLRKGKTRQVSRNSAGEPANDESDEEVLSPSGDLVVFHSVATNLPGGGGEFKVYLRNLDTGKTKLISKTSDGDPASGGDSRDPSISANERFVVFESSATNLPGDLGGAGSQVYVHDRKTGRTKLVSRAANADPAGPDSFLDRKGRYLSGDGSLALFGSVAGNLPGATGDRQVYVRGPLR